LKDVQSLVPQAQLSELTELPSSTEHDAYGLQVFVEAVQYKPLDDVQSLVPQAQLSELTAVPSSTEHDACRQVLVDDVQNLPLKLLQAALFIPHAQSTEFDNVPSMLEQLLPGLQVFVEDVQNKPDLASQ
jgi:hypothetical protein